ncbi:hypothetical protein DTO271G3_5044 [Paecilomyces variotii]|nr:hypothetical protein DTO271G3_5044 [Paecilomyces variotii]
MAKGLYKVQKQITKKRGKLEALHENSRDSQRLRRAGAREDRLARAAAVTSRTRQAYVDRVAFFQECLKDASGALSDNEMAELVQKFIDRGAPELEELRQERRKGRPPSKREDTLVQRAQVEGKEFTTGFWMPDFTLEEVVLRLKVWNGEWANMSTLKFIRLLRDGTKQASSFPPKGLS